MLPPATPAGKINVIDPDSRNVIDPDSRNVKTSRGVRASLQRQSAVAEQQIVIAAELTVDSPGFGHLEPMVSATETELARVAISTAPEVVLADAVYWHQVQMEAIVSRGMQVLIPPDAAKRKGERPGWQAAPALMRPRARHRAWRLMTAMHNLRG